MATRYASAALTWDPGYEARRRAPLQAGLLKMARMGLVVAALTCLGLTLLSALRAQGDSIGASLAVGAARAEVADR